MIAISSFKVKAAATGAACVAVGAVAGIVSASAAPTSKTSTSKSTAPALPQSRPGGRGFAMRRHGGDLGPAVHANVVVLNKAGTGFITATEDSGTVKSVSGNQLTIREGIGSVTYKTVTLTIPSHATIYRNFSTAALSAIKSGDRVRVEQSSEGTRVIAIDARALPPGGPGGLGHPPRAWRPGPGHPPGAWRHGGLPGGGRPGVLPQSGGATAPSVPVPQSGA